MHIAYTYWKFLDWQHYFSGILHIQHNSIKYGRQLTPQEGSYHHSLMEEHMPGTDS